MKKRILSVLLAVCLVAGMMPATPVLAEGEPATGDGILDPSGFATRAEVSAVLERVVRLMAAK